jgi:hypothetical protein
MNHAAAIGRLESRSRAVSSALVFAAAAVGLQLLAALLAGRMPLEFSIVTVFLFAGPHNWIEARYFLERLPARWGRLRGFFLAGLGGVAGLTAAFAALPWLAQVWEWNADIWPIALAVWNSAVILWIAGLIHIRSRQKPRRDWFWTLPVAFAMVALCWMHPYLWSLALVYLHPLMALWILDLELRSRRPEWRRAYHACLACLPLFLGVLWSALADAPPLAGEGEGILAIRIAEHAGAAILPGVSAHLLIATHTFLEMLHYGVWLLAIPLVGLRAGPWRLGDIPVARRSPGRRRLLAALLVSAAGVVLFFWGFFLVDYPSARDIYFTVAMLHVLAEVPFLLRAL